MRVFNLKSGVSGYSEFVKSVMLRGEERSPRGIATRDIGPATVVLWDVTESLPLGTGRNINRKIAAAEAIQLIGAFSEPELLFSASANFKKYAEPDGTFYGAYGSRIGTQASSVVHKLKSDSNSRQAVVTLWDPHLDNHEGKNDYPCTIALNFALVHDRLNMNVVMRSQDVWLGAPFDWFQFTQLMQTIADLLHVECGKYSHTSWSTHLYERNVDDVHQLTDVPPKAHREWQPRGLGGSCMSMTDVYDRARLLIAPTVSDHNHLSGSELWYREQLIGLI